MKIDSVIIKNYVENSKHRLGVLFLKTFYKIITFLVKDKKNKYQRVLPLSEYFIDRWEKAAYLGFGEGTSIYDSSIVIGDVKVGINTWIGPNTLLDGSGGLSIGSNCSISAGVQIYTHDTVNWALGKENDTIEYEQTTIGDYCYIAPNVVIAKGVTIGSHSVVGANSFVNQSIPSNSKAYGNPAKVTKLDSN